MKKIFLTSNMGCTKKIYDIKYVVPIDNINGIIKHIKDNLTKEDNFMFFASDPNDIEKTLSYATITFDSFNKSGFNFKRLIIVDSNYNGNLESDIKNADLIFLSGGKTQTQMKFFDKINLKELLKSYNGVLIGQRAGSINLADKVVCSPEIEEEIGTEYFWNGLDQTKINIEPHFKLEIKDNYEKKLREELLKISMNYTLYALKDGAYIYDDGKTQTIYGEAYLINKGKINNICNTGERKLL